MNKSRLEAFSDGVLAIIITIMVLEIKVPHSADWQALQPMVPSFTSYLLSFVFIGIYWGNHHHLLHTVKTISSGIIWANMALLFCLSLIPFATAWMGENGYQRNTVIAYSALLFACGISFTILQLAIQRANEFTPALIEAFAVVKRKGVFSLMGYAVAIATAFIDTRISCVCIVVVAIMWIVPDKNIEKALKN
jgi:uncharacterized membrane protein